MQLSIQGLVFYCCYFTAKLFVAVVLLHKYQHNCTQHSC